MAARRFATAACRAALTGFGVALACGVAAADRQRLSRDCEIAVAKSAAPARLRADASVYGLRNGAYEKFVDGSGPLTCVIERNHADSLIPQCMDRGGVDSVLPAIIERSLMAVNGASFAEIKANNERQLREGGFAPLPGAGISYMMSAYNYIFVESTSDVRKVAPHVMFYAPNLGNADIGGSFESMSNNIGTPFILNPGIHGYMIVYTQYAADPDEVAVACRGQLGEAPPLFNPFPKG